MKTLDSPVSSTGQAQVKHGMTARRFNHKFKGLTIGMGYNFSDRLTVDLALAYVYNDDHSIPKNTSKILNSSADGAGIIYNPYAGLDYEQKSEAYLPAINISYKW